MRSQRGQELRRHAIRRNHQVLDQALRAVAPYRLDVLQHVTRKRRPRLHGLERKRAAQVAALAQLPRHLLLHPDVRVQARHRREGRGRRGAFVEPGGHAVIGQPRMIADERLVDRRAAQRAIRGEFHLDDDRGAVDVEVQRRQIRRQPLRQHRKNACHGVDRGRVLLRMSV
jgi:hypothetical protein